MRVHNAVDGKERCVELGLRSLSVGDGRLYSCETVGWQRIKEVKT